MYGIGRQVCRTHNRTGSSFGTSSWRSHVQMRFSHPFYSHDYFRPLLFYETSATRTISHTHTHTLFMCVTSIQKRAFLSPINKRAYGHATKTGCTDFQHDTKITKLTPFIAFYSTTIDQCQNIIVMSFHTGYTNNNNTNHSLVILYDDTTTIRTLFFDIEPKIQNPKSQKWISSCVCVYVCVCSDWYENKNIVDVLQITWR